MFQVFRKERTEDDIRKSSLSLLIIVQSGPASLGKSTATKFEERLENEKDHQSADLVCKMV